MMSTSKRFSLTRVAVLTLGLGLIAAQVFASQLSDLLRADEDSWSVEASINASAEQLVKEVIPERGLLVSAPDKRGEALTAREKAERDAQIAKVRAENALNDAYFNSLKDLKEVPKRKDATPPRTKGNVAYVFVHRRLYSKYRGRRPSWTDPIYVQDSQLFRAEKVRRGAVTTIHRIELSDSIPWDHIQFVPECKEILKKWAENFAEKEPPIQPRDARHSFYYKKGYVVLPTLAKAEAHRKEHCRGLKLTSYGPPPKDAIRKVERKKR